jgi:hypothetical protein
VEIKLVGCNRKHFVQRCIIMLVNLFDHFVLLDKIVSVKDLLAVNALCWR